VGGEASGGSRSGARRRARTDRDGAKALEQVARRQNHGLVNADVVRPAEALGEGVEAVPVEPHHARPREVDDRSARLVLVPLHLVPQHDAFVRPLALGGRGVHPHVRVEQARRPPRGQQEQRAQPDRCAQ